MTNTFINQSMTKVQAAYEQLREEIISGDHEPGARIVIQAVAKRFGISDIPIREALTRLEAEGLVTSRPHAGFIVTEPDFKHLGQIFEARQLLEGQALWLAAEFITEQALLQLRELVDAMKQAPLDDIPTHVDLNYRFHDLLYQSSGNEVLYKLIKQTWSMAPRTKSIFLLFPERIASAIQEHETIYHALAERDSEKAKAAFLEHKRRAYELLIKYQGKQDKKKLNVHAS